MGSNAKKLRSGYTTGACAAAAAKAAATLVLRYAFSAASKEGLGDNSPGKDRVLPITAVEIPFPSGSRVSFSIHRSSVQDGPSGPVASASVIKDAGDDPDVTNGAEIIAAVQIIEDPSSSPVAHHSSIAIRGGRGVGTVTKPGLPIPVGEPAINPVPRKMIREAVSEALSECAAPLSSIPIIVTISVPDGEELAKKTLNARLGILGGISILGTSGIVRPLSTEAWISSITTSMNVARAAGLDEVVLAVGRVSEAAHKKKYGLQEEAYIIMGDHFESSLLDAKKHGFAKIHISVHWAKMLKISMSTPQTHVNHGAIDVGKAVDLLNNLGIAVPRDREFNTAREIYEHLVSTLQGSAAPLFRNVCSAAGRYAEAITGVPVTVHLVSYEGGIISDNQ